MSLILSMLGHTPVTAGSIDDDRLWSGGSVGHTTAGVHVSPENALKLSTVWACVGLLAETMAALPLNVYEQLQNDAGKIQARKHPLFHVLRRQPNDNQTAFEFWQMMFGHALLRGNGYAEIRPGPRGFADQLVPFHPDLVREEYLTNGRTRYVVRTENGEKKFTQDQIFHLRGMTLNGKTGLSVISYARESLGISMAAENYGARFFGNNSTPGGILSTPNKLNKEAAKKLKSDWEAAHRFGNQHRVAVLEHGLEWQQLGISHTDSQFLETREFQAEDICRWFRVPPWMVGLTSKSTSWGSGIEQMGIGFVTYTLTAWLVRTEQAISRDLILNTDKYFAKFVVNGLLRGDTATRFDAYAIAVQNGWLSPNEVRRKEDMNDRKDGDIYLTPMNMAVSETSGRARKSVSTAHYKLLAREAAARVVRKEIASLKKSAEKATSDAEWGNGLMAFYQNHDDLVASALVISRDDAISYTMAQMEFLIGAGPAGLNGFMDQSVDRLLSLMDVGNE